MLIVLLSVRAALLVVDLTSAPYVPAARTTQQATATVSRKVVDLPSILRVNLFGQSPPATGTDAPVTAMNLKLVLVIAADDEKKGLAALGPSLTDIKVYRVGDSVPGGAVLHAVYVDRVLLNRAGAIEALMVPPLNGQAAGGVVPPPVVANPAVSLARVQQVMQNNPNLLNQVIQRQAVFADGHLRGMRVNPGQNAQAFSKLGLRPGDLVTAINGTPLDDQARSNDVFNSMANSAVAHVTVVRGGKEQELNLNLADIANEAEKLADAPPPVAAPDTPPPPPGPDSER
ncbi:MAG: type II secretion system protein GspC [Pseudomonadota bacterium]